MNFLPSTTTTMIALALAAVMLSACAPTPEPTPTAAFASEEEAFAAAEETYRAYTKALNEQRAGDSDADPLKFLTGLALESELDTYEMIKGQGLTLIGTSSVAEFDPSKVELNPSSVRILSTVCVDISQTKVLDADKNDVTPTDRRERLPLLVTFVTSNSRLLISDSQSTSQATC